MHIDVHTGLGELGVPTLVVDAMPGTDAFVAKLAADGTSLTEGLGMLKAGKIDDETYRRLEECAMPTCGSCSFLGTANSMCTAVEAAGPSASSGPESGSATHRNQPRLAQEL